MRTDPLEQDECVAAFNAAYVEMRLPSPEYVFCKGPKEALQKIERSGARGQALHFTYKPIEIKRLKLFRLD